MVESGCFGYPVDEHGGPSHTIRSQRVRPLLSAKLQFPPVRRDLVFRPWQIGRLRERLHRGRRLTVVSASAGFGMTALLGEWVATCGQPVAWLAEDSGDNDWRMSWPTGLPPSKR